MPAGIGAEPAGPDPALADDGVTFYVTSQVYETLVTLEPDTALPVPDLAQSWSVSPDGRTWTPRTVWSGLATVNNSNMAGS